MNARLRRLLSRFQGRRVLVVGDVMLDEYLSGTVRRISPEAPIPVVELERETAMPGAAAYVASHVRHLGGEALLAGIVGDDESGARLRSLLRQRGIDTRGLLADPARPTIVKTRVLAKHQQMLRIDRERRHPLPAPLVRRLLDYVVDVLPGVQAVIMSDYHKGVLPPSLIRAVVRVARARRRPVAANIKPALAGAFHGTTVVSLNREEAGACLNRPLSDEDALIHGGRLLRRRLGVKALLITRHEHGMAMFGPSGVTLIPSRAKEVFDGTGAGDTVIAVTGLGLAARGRLPDCVHLANTAAGVEVAKLGCALVSREEIRRHLPA